MAADEAQTLKPSFRHPGLSHPERVPPAWSSNYTEDPPRSGFPLGLNSLEKLLSVCVS